MRDDLPSDVQTVLAPGEVVLDFTDGMFKQGALITSGARRTGLFVTDRRVGFFTRKIGGHKVLDFAYGLITSVEYKNGMAFGEIRISAPGSRVIFTRVPKEDVERVGQAIRDRVAMAMSPAAPAAQSPVSVADEIEKLAGIRDKGLLTEDEFQAQKAKLLGS
jgi:hypothetical protein